MMFAREAHKNQVRKYTGNPYVDHLAEVAGIVSTVEHDDGMIAVAWLHDSVEDCGVQLQEIADRFGDMVAIGVSGLSDVETGNRAERKALSRARLASSAAWIQTIKCADLISNTSSIVKHDPKFAVTYLEEKRLLLDVLTRASPKLLALAKAQSMKLAPQIPAGLEPLTDMQLTELAVNEEFLLFCDADEFIEIARAIEAAHNIKATK